MGDYADQAIQDSVDYEVWYAENYHLLDNIDREPLPFFDLDCWTVEDWQKESAYMAALLEYTPVDTQSKILHQKEFYLQKLNKKYTILRGMYAWCNKGKEFTDKQKKWLSTNWSGGYQQFVTDCESKGKEIKESLDKLIELTKV